MLRSVTKTSKQVWRERAEQQGPETQRGKKIFVSFIHSSSKPVLSLFGVTGLPEPMAASPGWRQETPWTRPPVCRWALRFLFMPNPFRPCIPLVSVKEVTRNKKSCKKDRLVVMNK